MKTWPEFLSAKKKRKEKDMKFSKSFSYIPLSDMMVSNTNATTAVSS
jgi:hypothetical protein